MKALFAAMTAAFPEIEGATKDSNNPHFKTKYADLSSVSEAIKPALAKHKLFFVQMTHEQAGGVCVETIVGHESGEMFSFGKLFVPAGKNDAQGYGSALTYARRYSLMTAFGVCPEDDDGNAAAKSAPQGAQAAPKIERVTPEQEIMLEDKMREAGVDPAKFLAPSDVSRAADLPAAHFSAAMKALNERIAKASKQPRREPQRSAQYDDKLADEVPY